LGILFGISKTLSALEIRYHMVKRLCSNFSLLSALDNDVEKETREETSKSIKVFSNLFLYIPIGILIVNSGKPNRILLDFLG
jgi:hypothetical protein